MIECDKCGELPKTKVVGVTDVTGWQCVDTSKDLWHCPTCLSTWDRSKWWVLRELSWIRFLWLSMKFHFFKGKK